MFCVLLKQKPAKIKVVWLLELEKFALEGFLVQFGQVFETKNLYWQN